MDLYLGKVHYYCEQIRDRKTEFVTNKVSRHYALALLVAAAWSLANCAVESGEPGEPFLRDALKAATDLIMNLSQGKTAEAYALCNEQLKNAKSSDDLAESWAAQVREKGEFKEIEQLVARDTLGMTTVVASCAFEKDRSLIAVRVDSDGLVDGVVFP